MSKIIQTSLFYGIGFILLLGSGAFAATLTVSPNSILSNHEGSLSISLSGIPAGAEADIELIMDFNSNGAVNSEDIVIYHAPLKDGVPPPVANTQLVGDDDAIANGTLVTRAIFKEGIYPEGKYLVRAKGTWGTEMKILSINPESTDQSVSGTVKNESGQPLQGIVWAGTEDAEHFTMINSNGTFTLYIPDPGNYQVGAWCPGKINVYEEGGAQEISLSSGQHMSGVNLVLTGGETTVSGRIYDTGNDQGLEGKFVILESEGPIDWQCETITDSDGSFSIPALVGPAELYIDDLIEFGYVGPNTSQLSIPAGGLSGLDFPMQKSTTFITGRVYRTDTSEGLWGIEMDIEKQGEENLYDLELSTTENGYYAIGVLEGAWRVELDDTTKIYSLGLAPAPPQILNIDEGQTLENTDFPLSAPEATVNVTVLDANQDPVSGLWIWMNNINWNYLGGSEIDNEGKISFGLMAGTYYIGIDNNDLYDNGYAWINHQTLTISTGEVRVLTFNLQDGIEVSGMVTEQGTGTPIPNAWINAMSSTTPWEQMGWTESKGDGSYRVLLVPGTYRFQANASNYFSEFFNEKPNDWSQGDNVNIPIGSGPISGINFTLSSSATLRGTVLRLDTQAPVTSAQVYIYNESNQLAWYNSVNYPNANFEAQITVGTYRIKIEPYTSGLLDTYYNQKSSLDEADQIVLTIGQTANITIWVPALTQNENPDVNGDGYVDDKDLFLLHKYWHQHWPQDY